MVGMHDLIVSPSSSSTSRSTPCVLGCCGPMLTVIVSVRTSAIQLFLKQLTKDVQHGDVHFLNSRRAALVNTEVNRRHLAGLAASPGQGDGDEPARVRGFESAQHIRRPSA